MRNPLRRDREPDGPTPGQFYRDQVAQERVPRFPAGSCPDSIPRTYMARVIRYLDVPTAERDDIGPEAGQ